MRTIDVKDLKIISVDEIPNRDRHGRYKSEWNELFDSIPEGKALVVKLENYNKHATYRSALWRRQNEGLYEDYHIVVREGTLYIINPSEGERKT